MSATKLTGVARPDGLIELTGRQRDFRMVLRQAGIRLPTIDLPGQDAEDAPAGNWQFPWQKAGPVQFALITQRDFAISGLAAWVDFPRNPAPLAEAEAARTLGTLLKTLLLDRRNEVSLERMAEQMNERMGVDAPAEALRDILAGKPPLQPGLLTAMLITLHVHKPLTPGSVAEFIACFAGQGAGQSGSAAHVQVNNGLAGLLKFPHAKVARAFWRRQISVTGEGEVTLAGVTVTPDITIFFPDTESDPPKRQWNNYRRRDLRQVSQGDKKQAKG